MLGWALAFFILAIVAALFGFGGIAAASAGIAQMDTSGNLLLRGAHGPIGFGFDIAVGLKGLFPLRPWPFEGGFAPVPPSWGHVEAILSSQHHRFML